MSKRANGEGSVYQRKDGRWVGSTYVLRPDGARQRKEVYGRTRSEVNSKLRELITNTERGVPMAGKSWTVGAYAEHWLANGVSALRPATQSNYAWVLRKYVVPTVGDIRLERLTPAHVRKLHGAVLSMGVSVRTTQLAHAVLRSMLAEAVREELITRNVGTLVRQPKLEKVEQLAWSPEEAARFGLASKPHRLHALFELAYSVGLRRGELLGLRWSDVDLETNMIHVRQTMQRLGAGHGRVFGPPKTARSRRSVPIPVGIARSLRAHRAAQAAELRGSNRSNPLDLVFTTSLGTPIEPSNLRRDFETLISAAGVPRIRFHDLRHTCASLLFAKGVPPRVVMDLLGHSTMSITTDLYAHVMPTALAEAASAMDDLLSEAADRMQEEANDE
ncbi:tyrosine-type recombinase/integrase [Agromyces sp. NPDC058136]|uniref:tyrosine-type recombinase/integrase n=1 Tax=Agromyces sp. NPDC058136 TaxID=3346354 RepID=UPI0036D947E5